MEDKSKRVELEVEDLVLASKLKLPAKEMVKRVRVEIPGKKFFKGVNEGNQIVENHSDKTVVCS